MLWLTAVVTLFLLAYLVAALLRPEVWPFLGLYGQTDQSPTPAEAQRFVEMLKPHNPTAEAVIFPNAGHAFFADYRPSYNPTAAADGWKQCLAHFDKHLKA